jgi:hypothetical protein
LTPVPVSAPASRTGWTDDLFSDQKSDFGCILEGLAM